MTIECAEGMSTMDWKLFIVQEFCDGGNLHQAISKGFFHAGSDVSGPLFWLCAGIATGLAEVAGSSSCWHSCAPSLLQYVCVCVWLVVLSRAGDPHTLPCVAKPRPERRQQRECYHGQHPDSFIRFGLVSAGRPHPTP